MKAEVILFTVLYWVLGFLTIPLWVALGGWVANRDARSSSDAQRDAPVRAKARRGEIFSVTNPADDR